MTPESLAMLYATILTTLGAEDVEVNPSILGLNNVTLSFKAYGAGFFISVPSPAPGTRWDEMMVLAYRNGLQSLMRHLDAVVKIPPYHPDSDEECDGWVECDPSEATQVLLDTMSGRFWAQSVQDRIRKMWEIGGYVIAKEAE